MNRSKTVSGMMMIWLALIPVFHSCDVMQQASQLRSLTRCEFRIHNVTGLTLAGVNIQHAESLQDLSLTDYAKITAAFLSGYVPLDFDLNIAARNPNRNMAAMNELDWILFIDGTRVTEGKFDRRVEIPPDGGTTVFPVKLNLDLLEALSSESKDAVLNFALNLAGNSERPTQLMLKAKPTIYIGTRAVEYPGYITIKTDFTSSGY